MSYALKLELSIECRREGGEWLWWHRLVDEQVIFTANLDTFLDCIKRFSYKRWVYISDVTVLTPRSNFAPIGSY